MSTTVTGSKRHLNINADEFAGDLNGTVNTATTATTQSTSDNSTKVATTAFVKAQGYGTSNLALGTTSTTALAGNTSLLQIGTTSTTAMAGNTTIPSISGLATTSYVDTAVSNLIDNAPANLNTLNELAEALNDDDDAIVTINTALSNRYTKTETDAFAVKLTGNQTITGVKNFTGELHWDLSAGEYAGDPRAVVMGYSGGNYGQLGYNIDFTTTAGSHTRVFNDIPTRMDLFNGIVLYAGAAGSAGSTISWTEILEAQTDAFQYKGNNIYYVGNDSGILNSNVTLSSLGAQAAGTYSTATGVANNADVTPSWVPSSDPSYLTSSSTQSKYLRSDESDTISGTVTSTDVLGFKVDSASGGRIEIESNNNWSYLRLRDNSSVSWDIASYDGGDLEWRPAGSSTNRMTYTSGGVLTTGDGFTSTKGNTAYGWGDHASGGYLSTSGKAADSEQLDGLDSQEYGKVTPVGTWKSFTDPLTDTSGFIDSSWTNKFEFFDTSNILVETSTDDSTYTTTTEYTDAQLKNLMGGDGNAGINIPNLGTTGTAYKRFTFTSANYVSLSLLYEYVTRVTGTLEMKVEKRQVNTWTTIKDYTNVGGWPAHVTLRHSTIWFNPSTTSTGHHWQVRVTIKGTTTNSSYINHTINKLQWWGGYPSGRRNLYYTDSAKNATFPADLTISGGDIILSGTGRIQGIDTVTASTDAASKAYVDGAVIANTDTQDLSISGRVISLTNGGSVTVPETTIPTIPSGNAIIDWTAENAGTIHTSNFADANTNYYLDGITKSGNTLTFSVNGTTNRTYTFGSNAFNSTTIPSGNAVIDWTQANAGTIHTSNYIENVDYELPAAAANTLGGIKVGTNLSISATGVLSATDTNTVYTHPTTAGNKHIPSGGGSGQFLKYSSSGTAVWATPSYIANTDTNKFLSGITKSSNTLTFAVTNGTNQTYTFGANAFNSTTIPAAESYTQHENISAASSNLNNSGRTYIQDITLDSNGHVTGVATATETVTNTNTQNSAATTRGFFSGSGINTSTGVITNTTYSTATSSALGLVKIGYSENNKNYPVELSSGKMFVNVPWENTQTANTFRAVEVDSSGNGSADYTLGSTETLRFKKGSNVSMEETGGVVTISATDTNTTYSVGNGGLTQNNLTNTLKSNYDTAYTHSQASHAPSNATANSSDATLLARANHTGTQAASTISDFDTEVANNSAVVANSAKTSNIVQTSVTGSSGSCTGNAATATTAGTVTTAAQSSITSLGTLTGLVVSGAISSSNTTQSTNKSSGSFKTNGGVGIAKTLNVGEDVVAYASSDKRYKDNLQAITNPIDKVKSLTGYTFTWNDKHEQFNGNNDIGVVAQEVEKVFPEIVDTRDNGYKAVKYEKMVAVLIEAVKDQQKQIDELKEKLNGNS